MPTLFIAHVEEDKEVALGIALDLESRGYGTWCYEIDNPPGTDYVDRILDAVKAAQVVVVVLSPQTLEHRDQVAREVYAGEGKPFIPLLLEIAEEAYEQLIPKPWRETFRNAVLLSVHPDRLSAATDEIVRGLPNLRVEKRPIDAARLAGFRALLTGGRDPRPPWKRSAVRLWRSARRWLSPHRRRRTAAALALLIAAWLVYRLAPERATDVLFDRDDNAFNLWIEDAELVPREDVKLRTDQVELLDQFNPALTAVFNEMLAGRSIHFLSSAEVQESEELEGCADLPNAKQRQRCFRKEAIRKLDVDARIVPTLKARSGDLRRLNLKVEIPQSDRFVLSEAYLCDDGHITILAKCGAEHVAAFVIGAVAPAAGEAKPPASIVRARIKDALRPDIDQKFLEDLDQSLDASPSAGMPLDLFDLIGGASAYAQTPADAAAVQKALDELAVSMESRDPAEIAPRFAASLSDPQQKALERYFSNMDRATKLEVRFVDPIVTFNGDAAEASFLRVDQFKDKDSQRPVRLAVRVTATLVRVNGTWMVQALKRPS